MTDKQKLLIADILDNMSNQNDLSTWTGTAPENICLVVKTRAAHARKTAFSLQAAGHINNYFIEEFSPLNTRRAWLEIFLTLAQYNELKKFI